MDESKSYYLGNGWGSPIEPQPGSREARELDIRIRARELWKEAGMPENDDLKFWLQAEKEFDEIVGDW